MAQAYHFTDWISMDFILWRIQNYDFCKLILGSGWNDEQSEWMKINKWMNFFWHLYKPVGSTPKKVKKNIEKNENMWELER